MNTYTNQRMSASASPVLNFEEGDELSFLASILHSVGASKRAGPISANLVLDYLGGAASVRTWGNYCLETFSAVTTSVGTV